VGPLVHHGARAAPLHPRPRRLTTTPTRASTRPPLASVSLPNHPSLPATASTSTRAGILPTLTAAASSPHAPTPLCRSPPTNSIRPPETRNSGSRFSRTTFKNAAGFEEATFEGEAEFRSATFESEAQFGGATFEGAAWFDGTTFERARQFGPVLVGRQLSFEAATFKQRVQINAAAATLCAVSARFLAGVQLRLRWAQVVLDDADLAAPSILAGVPSFDELDEGKFPKIWRRLPPRRDRDGWPRLLSLRRADVAGLTVANADLGACRFVGAHNLDQLRVEGNANFGDTPNSWWWATRQTIAEEHHWRSNRRPPTGFQPGNRHTYLDLPPEAGHLR
jgi:uncharacterized protein YjbI with pentapeptide repeats